MRHLLQPTYKSLVDFTQLPEAGCEWEDYVNVRLGVESRFAFRAAQGLLRFPAPAPRPVVVGSDISTCYAIE